MERVRLHNKQGEDIAPDTLSISVYAPDGRTVEQRNAEQMAYLENIISGRNSDGNAKVYPLLYGGDWSSVGGLNTAIDNVFSNPNEKYQGHLRFDNAGFTLFIDQFLVDVSNNYCMQVAMGPFAPSSNGLTLVRDASTYHIVYRIQTNNSQSALWQEFGGGFGGSLKTINGISLKGTGNIEVGSDGSVVIDSALDPSSPHAIANSVVANEIGRLENNISNIGSSAVIMVKYWGNMAPDLPTYQNGDWAYEISTNTLRKKINGAWVVQTKDTKVLYVNINTGVIYRWNGDSMVMLSRPVIDVNLSNESTNAVQNKTVYAAIKSLEEFTNIVKLLKDSGTIVVVDQWAAGVLPVGNEGDIGYSELRQKLYVYTDGAWVDGPSLKRNSIYIDKENGLINRWSGSSMDVYTAKIVKVDSSWVDDSQNPVQSKLIKNRFEKIERTLFGATQNDNTVDDPVIENNSISKDLDKLKDTVLGEVPEGGIERQGGLNTELNGIKDSLYGQEGTVQAPAQGSISQKVSTLETEAIKGIKVNGQTVSVIDGVANVTIREQQERAGSDAKYLASVVSDVQINQTTYGANTLEIEIVDYVPAVSSEAWDGSGNAKVVYNSQAANLLLRVVKDEVTTYYSDWESATNIPAKRYIGSSTLLNYEADDDTCLATFNNGTLVQVADCTLCVDAVTSRLLLRKDGVYYWSWLGVEKYHSSEYISDNGIIIQFKLSGTTFLASYNKTEHKITPIGGGNDAIALIDNSDKPVQSATLQREFNIIDGKIANIESNLGISKGNSSFKLLSDSDEAFATFDYSKGNLGCFTPKVAPEEITVEDVDSIYTVKLPYGIDSIEELPIKTSDEQEIEGKYLVADTYLELQLPTEEESEGTTIVNNHASDNRNRLIDAFSSGGKMYDENCIGIKFTSGKRYYVLGTNPTGVASRRTGSIVLPRDFILDGSYDEDVNSSGTSYGKLGGLIITTENALFYTEHSLVVNKLYVKNNGRNSNYSFYMDYERGVDQLQVTKCIFESDGSIYDTGSNPKGNFFRLYSPSPRPYRYKQEEYDYVDEFINSGQDTDNKGRDWWLERVAYSNTSKDSIREVVNKITAEDVIHAGDALTLENLKLDIPSPSCINHIYIQGCSFEGGRAVNAESLRVVKSCRIVNNKFHTIMTPALDIGIANAEKAYDDHSVSIIPTRNTYNDTYYCNYHRYYAYLKSAMRCPFYIVGNTFTGLHDDLDSTKLRIYKPMHGKTGGYHTAMLLEGGTFYILHNVIEDIVSAAWYASGRGRVVETYDAYCNSYQLYYENNTVRNIARFSTLTGDVGICKGKNMNISAPYANASDTSTSTGIAALTADWYNGIGGGCLSMPFVRHYKNNHYSVDVALLKSSWEHYLSRVGTEHDWYNENTSADEKTNINDVIVGYLASSDNEIYGIHFACESVTNSRKYANNLGHPILEEYVFSNNIVDATDGTITGMVVTGAQEGHTDASGSANDDWPVNKAIFSNNTFIAKEFEHNAKNPLTQRDTDRVKYLFRIKLQRIEPDFKKTYFEVVGNTFICPENVTTPQYGIRFICNRFVGDSDKIYPELASDNAGDTCVIKDNKVIVPQSLLGTNIPIVISKAKTSTATAYEHIRTIVDKELKKEEVGALSTTVSELGRTVEDVETGVSGINKILRGEDVDDISSIIPYNPSAGDKYKVVGTDGTEIYTCTGSGVYARVCFRFDSDYNKSASHVLGNIQIPFSPNELNNSIMTKAEIAEAIAEDAKLGAATPVSEYQYINNNVDVAAKLAEFAESENGTITASSRYEAAFVLEVVLKARGYKYASLATRSAMNTLLGTNGKGGFFDIYTESYTPNTYVRVMPAYAYDSRTFITNDTARGSATSALKNLVKNTSSSYFVQGNGENSYNSLQGSTPSWSEPVLSTGMIDMVGALLSNVTLYHTIIVNLLTEINTLRGQHSLSPLVINDDGSISEQQSS